MMLAEDILDDAIEAYAGKEMEAEEWDLDALKMDMSRVFGLDAGDYVSLDFTDKSAEEIREALWERIVKKYDAKETGVGADMMRQVERFVMLETVDRQWKDHLYSLDHLKEGIGLRGYGQKDPLVEYKRESFELFQDMKRRVDEDMVNRLWMGQFTVVGDEAPRASAAPPAAADDAERAQRGARWSVRAAPSRRRCRQALAVAAGGAAACRRRRRADTARPP